MSHVASAIIANSRAVAHTIPSFARGKTTVVYNGVRLAEFDPARWDGPALRRELGFTGEHLLVGNVGWIAPWKRQDEFIEAAARIAGQCPQARFVVAGDTSDERYLPYARELRAHAAQALGEKLCWIGARRPIQPVLAALDLLLHCAEREPFGRVLIEAMAMRLPVVAFSGEGPDEIIAPGESGLLVASHDPALMAQAALTLLAEPGTRRALGDAGRARVQSLFDSDANVRQVQQIYDSVRGRRDRVCGRVTA
jgi:glycosyltransferase involved in cell wall biosynthesis